MRDDEKETRKIVLWKVGATDKATLYSDLPKSDPKHKTFWIPRSLIHHVSANPAGVDEWPQCIVEVEEWFLDRNDL